MVNQLIMGRKSTAKVDLISAGMHLFHKYGYQGVSISQLCDYASVRSGTFFYFFKSKEAYAKVVLDETWKDFNQFLLEKLEEKEKSPLLRLFDFLTATYYYIKSQPSVYDTVVGCPFGNLLLEISPDEEILYNRLVQAIKDATFVVEQTLREAIKRGEIEEPDPQETAQMIIAAIEGSWLLAKTHNDPELVKRLQKKLIRLIKISDKVNLDEYREDYDFL